MTDAPGWFRAGTYVIAGLPVLVGLAMAAVGLRRLARERRLRDTGVRASGVIVDNRMESGTDRQLVFSPVVQFQTTDGRSLTVPARQRSRRSYVVGTPVGLVYDPARPEDLVVDASGAGARAYVAAGVGFAIFGLVIGAVFSVLASR